MSGRHPDELNDLQIYMLRLTVAGIAICMGLVTLHALWTNAGGVAL